MRVVVPFRQGMLFGRTYDAAREWGSVEFVELRNPDEPPSCHPTYLELVQQLWRDGEGFLILEHDVVPREGDLQGLVECPRYWCGFHYSFSGGYGNFGCSKIGQELIRATRDFYEPGARMGFLRLEESHLRECEDSGDRPMAQWERVHPALVVAAHRWDSHNWHCHGTVPHRATRHDPADRAELGDEHLRLNGASRPTDWRRTPHSPLMPPRTWNSEVIAAACHHAASVLAHATHPQGLTSDTWSN
jgi:hypothetical protein